MYSVIMHSGSSVMHTASSRMMLGSFSRDMILISFRKSFLSGTETTRIGQTDPERHRGVHGPAQHATHPPKPHGEPCGSPPLGLRP